MPKITVNDVEIYYEFKGNPNGPTVVLVNGLLTDTASWNAHLPLLGEKYRLLVYDCRGQGQSDKPDQPYETSLHIADLAALIEALEIEQAHFVGLSNGGAIVLAYAADHPERVLSVVAADAYSHVETILKAKLTSWVRAMEAGGSPLRFDVALPWVWGGGFLEKNYESLQYFREKGVNLPIGPAMNLIKGAMVHDIRDKLPQVEALALIIVGDEDVLTPVKYSREIAAAIPNATLHIMEGIGHAAALEDVEGFCERVLTFFAAVDEQDSLVAQTDPESVATGGSNAPSIQAGDLSIHFIERGAGEEIVFIHGNWATASWWEPTLERLPVDYRGIAYDQRGRGQTEGPDSGYTMPEMAVDLEAFIDALGLEKVHLVGHSLGSAVVMQFALEHPERVLTLTAVAPAWVDGMPEALNAPAGQLAIKADKELFAHALKPLAPTAPDDEFWQRLVDEGHQQRIEAALLNLPALVAWKPGDSLGATGVPALVISGTLDPLTGATAPRAADALRARIVVLDNIGHSPIIEAPEQFVALLLDHIARRK